METTERSVLTPNQRPLLDHTFTHCGACRRPAPDVLWSPRNALLQPEQTLERMFLTNLSESIFH